MGPVLQIPGERIKLDAQTDSIILGLNVQFGAPRKKPDNSVLSGETYTVPPAVNSVPAPASPAPLPEPVVAGDPPVVPSTVPAEGIQ